MSLWSEHHHVAVSLILSLKYFLIITISINLIKVNVGCFAVENTPDDLVLFNAIDGCIQKISGTDTLLSTTLPDLVEDLDQNGEDDFSYEIDEPATVNTPVSPKKGKKKQGKKSCPEREKVLKDLTNIQNTNGEKKPIKEVAWNDKQEEGLYIITGLVLKLVKDMFLQSCITSTSGRGRFCNPKQLGTLNIHELDFGSFFACSLFGLKGMVTTSNVCVTHPI